MGLRPSLEDALFGCAAFEAIRFVPLEDDGVPEYDDGSVYRGDPHVAIMQETLAEVRAATAAFVERHQAALSPEVLALLRDNAAASRGGALCGGVLSVDAHPDLVRACDALGWRAHLERFVEQFDLYRMPREHHAAASALVDSLCAALMAEAPSARLTLLKYFATAPTMSPAAVGDAMMAAGHLGTATSAVRMLTVGRKTSASPAKELQTSAMSSTAPSSKALRAADSHPRRLLLRFRGCGRGARRARGRRTSAREGGRAGGGRARDGDNR